MTCEKQGKKGLDYLIRTETDVEECIWFFTCSWIWSSSLAYVCRKYGKKAVIFHANRKIETRHRLQLKAEEFGATIEWVQGTQAGLVKTQNMLVNMLQKHHNEESFLLASNIRR